MHAFALLVDRFLMFCASSTSVKEEVIGVSESVPDRDQILQEERLTEHDPVPLDVEERRLRVGRRLLRL